MSRAPVRGPQSPRATRARSLSLSLAVGVAMSERSGRQTRISRRDGLFVSRVGEREAPLLLLLLLLLEKENDFFFFGVGRNTPTRVFSFFGGVLLIGGA